MSNQGRKRNGDLNTRSINSSLPRPPFHLPVVRTHRRVDRETLVREPRLYHTDDDLQRARLDEEATDGLESAHGDVDDALEGERVEVGGVQCRHGWREAVYRREGFSGGGGLRQKSRRAQASPPSQVKTARMCSEVDGRYLRRVGEMMSGSGGVVSRCGRSDDVLGSLTIKRKDMSLLS